MTIGEGIYMAGVWIGLGIAAKPVIAAAMCILCNNNWPWVTAYYRERK